MSLSVGHPNYGWQLRSKLLRDTPYLKVRENCRAAAYGHPALVLMLRRSARDVARAHPGSVMVVGDLSGETGGPLPGHASHQSGRDADVGFFVRTRAGEIVVPERFAAFDGNGHAKNGSGWQFDDARNWLLVSSWVKDPRAGLSHVFVSRALRTRLLEYAERHEPDRALIERAAQLLKQPQSTSAHDDHFHVRIACPARQEGICHESSR
jgi:penicillin-insensitive murein endopeptidase